MPLIDKVLSETEVTLSSIPAAIVIQEIYDEECGIYESSTAADGPYALVSLHEAEDMSLVDPFDREMDKYLNANVLKYTGITFERYLEFTRDKCEKLLLRCDALAEKEAKEAEAAMNPLRDKAPPTYRRQTRPQARKR